MELFPSEYQQLDLNRYEKVFIRHALNCAGDFGMLLLRHVPGQRSVWIRQLEADGEAATKYQVNKARN